MKHLPLKLPLVYLVGLLSGCATLGGTDFAQQSTEPLNSIKAWSQEQVGASKAVYLTDLMQSEDMLQLIQRGLDKNPGLRQSLLAVQIARENLVDVNGNRLPQVNLNLSQGKTKNTDAVLQTDLQVSWTVDWLHKLKDELDAGKATLAQRVAADQYVRDLLAASIMSTWLQLIQQGQLIEIEGARLKVLEQNETTIVERYRKGLDELSDLDSARSQSASSRARLVAYREDKQVLLRSMASLLGEIEYKASIDTAFPEVNVPLASMPAQDLGRRPDLQQAFLDIKVADLNSAIAYKALLPSLSLNLSLAQTGSAFRNALFTSPAWSLLNQLTAPLFQGGKLRAQARKADLVAEQAYWAYQEQLLLAVKEVEDAMGQEQSLSTQQGHIEEALENAERSFEIYQTKYRQGLASFLDLLTVQTQTFDLQIQKTQLIYQRLSNRISLGLALGLGVSS